MVMQKSFSLHFDLIIRVKIVLHQCNDDDGDGGGIIFVPTLYLHNCTFEPLKRKNRNSSREDHKKD